MFVESAFITREFKEEQIPILENITCLSVINTGTSVALINGVSVYPSQEQILIVPDGTHSRVQLSVTYLESKSKIIEVVEPQPEPQSEPQSLEPRQVLQPQNKVLLIYKKLI